MAEETEEIADLASVGKGRALLDLGLFAEAAAAVAVVPTEFQYVTEHADSPLRLQNAIYVLQRGLPLVGVGRRGRCRPALPHRGGPPGALRGRGGLGPGRHHAAVHPRKYPDASASVVVADGIEARLIEAEAQLQIPDLAGMTATLNDLRDAEGLDPLAEPGYPGGGRGPAVQRAGLLDFATGHRLGDMRRLIRQYGRTAATSSQSGTYIKGGSYGTDVNLPIPQEEQNNPNRSGAGSGCLRRRSAPRA